VTCNVFAATREEFDRAGFAPVANSERLMEIDRPDV